VTTHAWPAYAPDQILPGLFQGEHGPVSLNDAVL